MSETLSLTCEISGGKPAPIVVWRRDHLKISQASENIQVSVSDEDDGRQKISSTLKLSPTSDDNGVYYSCESQSNFTHVQLSAGVTLDVLYPPGRPSIEGYRINEKIRAGDTVNIRCVSRGGNPLAWLVWTKNGDFVDHSYMTSDGEAVNEITFVAAASDDKALYLCSASSSITTEPMEKSITLKVLYAPSSVNVETPKEAKPGDVISATCKTDRSNPAAEVTWVVDGIPIIGENLIEEHEEGGWTTTSKINVNVTTQDRNAKLFTCYAVNQELGETRPHTSSVSILYAPDPPTIFGYTEGVPIAAGNLQRLTCVSHGGNPLPELKWHKGDEEIKSPKQTTSGNIVSKELIIVASASDNGAKYSCISKSKALSEPLISGISLTVHFSPSNVSIKVRPKKPKAESEVKLYCQTTTSNPASNITWWKGRKNEIHLESSSESVSPSKDGNGYISKASIQLNVSAEDDGSKYTCQAQNQAIKQSIHDTVILSILYKPIFKISDPAIFEVKENDSTVIDVTAKANPNDVTYKWRKNDEVIEEGPHLNITAAERSQSGEYDCQASNEQGETTLKVILKVLFPATIAKWDKSQTKDVVIAEPESNVRLQCVASGYPLTENTIKWTRADFDMTSKTEILSNEGGKSILGIKNVTKDVSGEFTCTVDNGIGSPDSWNIFLLVKHTPVIKNEANNTVFSDRGVSVTLYCTAEGVPDVAFTWSLEGVVISDDKERMKKEVVQLDHITWQGTLTIDKVAAEDFGDYKCVARNEIGFETTEISLLPDSAPDPPVLIKILNTTKDSFHIAWVPGFSGGHNQTHRVRYKSIFDPSFSYVDVHPPESNTLWLKDLKADMDYEIALMSSNEKGQSHYTAQVMKAKTLGIEPYKPKPEKKLGSLNYVLVEILASTVGTIFLLLFLFNIILLSLYYRKKKPSVKKVSSDEQLSRSSSKVSSEETTFTEDSQEASKETYDTVSIYSTESISTADDEETEDYFEDIFNTTKNVSGVFI